MNSTVTHEESQSRLLILLNLLESDPDNVALLRDAAEQALAEQQPKEALELLSRRAALVEPGPTERNLAGLSRLQSADYEGAADEFARLLETGVDDPPIRFNLAWARAMVKDQDGALALLDESVTTALPQAAMLDVQLLHDRGEFELAGERARQYLGIHPTHPGLNAAISVLALDIEDKELARAAAILGGDHPDALATMGTLALDEDRAGEALDHFNRALSKNEGVPRAWIGRGLAKLLTNDSAGAPADLDRGAKLFGDHLGSWIAAGWGYLINGDLATCRSRFETALALDPTFAETHGSLAALDAMEGRMEDAESKAEIALRLDRQCFSAAFAKMLIANSHGDQETARAIFKKTIDTPINDAGQTIGQAMARIGLISN